MMSRKPTSGFLPPVIIVLLYMPSNVQGAHSVLDYGDGLTIQTHDIIGLKLIDFQGHAAHPRGDPDRIVQEQPRPGDWPCGLPLCKRRLNEIQDATGTGRAILHGPATEREPLTTLSMSYLQSPFSYLPA